MPIKLQIDQERQLTKFIASGMISSTDLTTALESFFSSEVTQNILWDFRNSNPGEVFLPRKIKKIIDFAKEGMLSRTDGKTAIVALPGIGFSLSKSYEAFTKFEKIPYSVKAFNSIDEAMSWINL
jgi:hypothetical protein